MNLIDYADTLHARLDKARLDLDRVSRKLEAARAWEQKCWAWFYDAQQKQTIAESWEQIAESLSYADLARARAIIARAETERCRARARRAQLRVWRLANYRNRIAIRIDELEYRLNMW